MPRLYGPDGPSEEPRREALAIDGPVIDIVVRCEPGAERSEEGYPSEHRTGALIDTGASEVCIDYRIAHALDLREVDQRMIVTPGGNILVKVFLGLLEVPSLGFSRLMPLYAPKVERLNYAALLGRSFLKDFYVTFEGPTGRFVFVHKDDAFPPPPEDEG